MIQSLTHRFTLLFVLLDVVFSPLVMVSYLNLLGVENKKQLIPLIVGLVLVKLLSVAWFFRSRLADYENFARETSEERKKSLLLAADDALQKLPRRFTIFYPMTWGFLFLGAYLYMRLYSPDNFALAAESFGGVLLIMLSMFLGAACLAYPFPVLLTADARGQCSVLARQSGITLPREPVSLQGQIATMSFAFAVGPMVWIVAVGYMSQVDERGQLLRSHAEVASLDLLRWTQQNPDAALPEAGISSSSISEKPLYLVHRGGQVQSSSGSLTEDQQLVLERVLQSTSSSLSSHYDRRRQMAVAAYPLTDGSRLVAVVQSSQTAGLSFLIGSAIFGFIVMIWAPINAAALARAISVPIERLTQASQKIIDEGKQTQMAIIPVIRQDEVGTLSERFNDLLDMMRDLSHGADAIANGNLGVKITRKGELPDAFRRMVEGLQTLVSQIRQTSVELAGAATEIFAASQEQEAAATSQSSAMTEISHTMDSLSQSAAHVSEAVQGVLSNAEQSLITTDTMVERIESLSTHSGRISELLEVIRDIADRSDLLALNGSLEASRAGEGGQGFALVASEMRRLAERVTASVEDVKTLITDIRESSASTIMATEESRRLARGTTDAARQITFVTQQQRSGTEQVSQSVKEITDVITQSAAATSQTRTSAQNLKAQADALSQLVQQFEFTSEDV